MPVDEVRRRAVHDGAAVELELRRRTADVVGVVARRPKTGTAPIVATLSNPRGEPVVSTQHRDSAEPAFAILGALLDPSRFQRILPERVYGMVLA